MPFARRLGFEINFVIRLYAVVLDFPVAFRIKEAEARRSDTTAIHQGWYAADPYESAPGALADERSQFCLAEVPRHGIAARSCKGIDDHHLRAENGGFWSAVDFTVTRRPPAHQ